MNPEPPVTSDASEAVTPESLRKQYEAGATVDELVAASGLSYGTVLNRLHEAGTEMRTSWQTRWMRQDPQARQRLAAHLRTLYEQHGATLTELAAAGAGTRRAARRLLIEAGGTVRSPQHTLRMRTAARAAERLKLALSCGHGTRPAPRYRTLLRTATTPWPRSTGSCTRPAPPCGHSTTTARPAT